MNIPQAIDIEEIVLGSILLESEAAHRALAIVNEQCFFHIPNQIIFRCISYLYKNNMPIDISIVTNQLNSNGYLKQVGGPHYVATLTNKVASSANIEAHCRILYQKFLQRRLIDISQNNLLAAQSEGCDVFNLIEQYEKNLGDLTGGIVANSSVTSLDLHAQLLERNKTILTSGGITGIPSYFTEVDKIMGGWKNKRLLILAGRPGSGKCLGLGTKIIMFDGKLKNVEDIIVGDKLMGPDSNPRTVLSLARGQEQMYWIRQNKGIDYRVNESHILSLKSSGTEGSRIHGEVVNISVKDYLSKSRKFQIRHKGYKSGFNFEEQEIIIDPYLLGLWLGDGSQSGVKISNPDKEVIDYLQSYADEFGMQLNNHNHLKEYKCPTWCLTNGMGQKNQILNALRHYNLIDNKHIPHVFYQNSRENRLKLLAGLIDTDGYLDQKNMFEITQVNERLAREIKMLCHSLGFGCTIKEVRKGIKSINFIGTYFRLIISGDIHLVPTKIKRKQAPLNNPNKSVLVTGINVEKDIVDDYYGFEIDGDHLFLLEDSTVTHNTAIAIQFASNPAVNAGLPVAIFSLEMGALELYERMQSQHSGIASDKITRTGLTDYDISQLSMKLANSPIHIDDTPSISVFELRSRARKLKREKGIKLIVVDYLQLMTGGSDFKGSREQEIGFISRSLKALSKELDVPIIALSQLSRGVESRGSSDHRPKLSDLRESGSIEQDADIVMFIHRPEYFGIMQDANGNSTAGKAELIIAKHRGGPLADIPLNFEHAKTKFSDYQSNNYMYKNY